MEGEKQMYQGDWQCSQCGKAITQLPFQPKGTANLRCIDCFKNKSGGGSSGGGERQMVQGNWTCANCGNSIKELPFTPREGSNLKCRDCFRAEREG